MFGAALFILLTYVVYHVISKVRGNEKNGPMNNYGQLLAVLGFAFYSVYFIDFYVYRFANDEWDAFYDRHETLY